MIVKWFAGVVRGFLEYERNRQSQLAQLDRDIAAAAAEGRFNWTTPDMHQRWIGFRRSAAA